MATLNEILSQINGSLMRLNESLFNAGTSGTILNERLYTLQSVGSGGGGGETEVINAGFTSFAAGASPLILASDANAYTDTGATTLAVVGDTVAAWTDKNKTHTFTQSTAGARPSLVNRYGKSALLFDGVDDHFLNSSLPDAIFKTYKNQTDSDKRFTFVILFEPILGTARSELLRVDSTTNANSFTRFSIADSANNNVIEWNKDVDANLGDLLYRANVTPRANELNMLVIVFDGEKGHAYLHNSQNDCELILSAPLGHNSPMSSLDRMLIGASSGTGYFNGYLFSISIYPDAFFGVPSLVTETRKSYGVLPPTAKTQYSFQEGIISYAPLQFVSGHGAGVTIGAGRYDVETVGTLTNQVGPDSTELSTLFPGTNGNYSVIQHAGSGGILSDLCNISKFTLSFDLNVKAAAAVQTVFSVWNNSNAQNFFEIQISTARLASIVIYNGSGASTSASCSAAIPLNTWVKIWVYSNGTNMFITVNDETVGSVARYANRLNSTTNIRLGTALPGTRDANVAMANIVMWSRELTGIERAEYNTVGFIR